jgi:hypothetical protein
MANEIIDKLYAITEESKKQDFTSSIKFADHLAKQQREEFSYLRNNKLQYCEWQTVREYIVFTREIALITDKLKMPDGSTYRTMVGFKTWVGDNLLIYFDNKGIPINSLSNNILTLIENKTLPTAEKLYESLKPSMSEKHFRWGLVVLNTVKPLTIDVCRKWIWLPKNTYEF